jgi:hypothetical protein
MGWINGLCLLAGMESPVVRVEAHRLRWPAVPFSPRDKREETAAMTRSAFAKSGRMARHAYAPLALLIVSIGLGACSKDEATPNFPVPPPEESREWLFDVTGNGPDDVYVAGNLGVMYHYDGSAWTRQDMGTTAAITTVWSAPTQTEVWAVGHGGGIWRNSGGGWGGMTSNTTANLYGIGSFDNQIMAVGANGTILRLNGSTWGGRGGTMFVLDENEAPIDTLVTDDDLSSMVAVNHYFLGGAYFDPSFEGERFGIKGTKGNVLAANTDPTLNGPWILRPLSGEALVEEEWILCMSSDPAALDRNYLGTSEGWLFRLTRNDEGKNVWQKFYPELTNDPGAGIRDIWVDANNNAYCVTDEGQVIYQTADYSFTEQTGTREVLYDNVSSFVGIWGSGPDDIYFVGYYDATIFHGVHDPVAGTFTVSEIPVEFPASKAVDSLGPGLNELGLPLR